MTKINIYYYGSMYLTHKYMNIFIINPKEEAMAFGTKDRSMFL